MPLVPAIEPDQRQGTVLKRIVREHIHADLLLVDTPDAAVAALSTQIPDVILVSALLSPPDEEDLLERLRSLDGGGHIQTYTIPQFASTAADEEETGGFFGKFRRKKNTTVTGCDPDLFGQDIVTFVARAHELRSQSEGLAARALRISARDGLTDTPINVETLVETSDAPATESASWASPFEWRRTDTSRPAPPDAVHTREKLDASPAHSDTAVEALQQQALAESERAERARSERARAEELARLEAENARQEEEAAKLEAENARREEEAARLEAENARREEEAARLEAENARREEEAAKLKAENARREEEAARLEAENARREEEAAKLEAENARREEEARLEAIRLEEEARQFEEEVRRFDEERRRFEEEALRLEEAARAEEERRLDEQRQREGEAERERREAEDRARVEAESAAGQQKERERQERLAAAEAIACRRRDAKARKLAETRSARAVKATPAPGDVAPLPVPEAQPRPTTSAAADQYAEFREEHDGPRGLLRLMPLDRWARTGTAAKAAVVTASEPHNDLQDLIAGLSVPPEVAAITYPRGCRIRRVRVRALRTPPEHGPHQAVIVSRRALEASRAADQAQADRR